MSKGKKTAEQPEENSDPITNPEEVPESNDEKIDQDFPGYPHYPSEDDIMNPKNNSIKVDVDVENINKSPGHVRQQQRAENLQPNASSYDSPFAGSVTGEDELGIVEGTEADVTDEDLMILESTEGNIIRAKEEDLVTTDSISDLNVEDLDLPGTELDDHNEAIGEEDEENNYYSIGSDLEDRLEQDHEQ